MYTARPVDADPVAVVADDLRGARGDVARDEVPEARVALLEEVVALVGRDLVRRPVVARLARHPDAAVVAKRLAHQGQLRLVVARLRDAGRVDLREARVGEPGPALVRPPGRRDVAAHGVGRAEVDVAVAAGGEDDRVGGVALDLAGDEVADDHAPGASVDDDDVEQLVPRVDVGGPLRRPAAGAPGRRRAEAAGRSGRGSRTCARRGRRRTSGWPASRRTRG